MTILIANIGTSDLSVKIDDYYIPIGFNRDEPNTDESVLVGDEPAIWEREFREEYIAKELCPTLGVTIRGKNKFSFRELTQKLRDAYEANPEQWHPRIRPGRIWGVIKEAREKFEVKTVYLFVTDQPHSSDTVYLFEVLQVWVRREFGEEIELKSKTIPENVPANNLDKLLQEYYIFFCNCDPNEQILISIKGGTPQMQIALRVQAMSSAVKQQTFLEPVLSIKKLLAGEPSECQRVSYWRYQRTQKYQTVKLLLGRWDFDGAREVLEDWYETLTSLSVSGAEKARLAESQKKIGLVLKGLNVAVGYLNLDYAYASSSEKSLSSIQLFNKIKRTYDRQLNLYSQCRIDWKLDRTASFLSRVASFCEDIVHKLIVELGDKRYFDQNDSDKSDKYPPDWKLQIKEIHKHNQRLLDYFRDIEDPKKNKKHLHNSNFYQFKNRFSKRNFLKSLIEVDNKSLLYDWNKLLQSLERLDYWVEKRNDLIHSAKGISKKRMAEVQKWDCDRFAFSEKEKEAKEKACNACPPDDIVLEMSEIVRYTFSMLGEDKSELLDFVLPVLPKEKEIDKKTYEDAYEDADEKTSRYIYDEIAAWVVEQLDADAKK